MIVAHPESNTAYCDVHFQVVDADGRCPVCDAEPRPTLYVDHNAIDAWRERIDIRQDIIGAIQKIVTEGREVPGTGRFPGSSYYVNENVAPAVVVVKANAGGRAAHAVVTVLPIGFLEWRRTA